MDQTQINEVMSHKHLGIIFTNDCNWHEHIEHIKAKAWNRIKVMRKLKFKLDRKSLQTIYIFHLFVLYSPGLATQLWSDGCVAWGVYIFQDIAKVWS